MINDQRGCGQYLNHNLEQDHRAINRRLKASHANEPGIGGISRDFRIEVKPAASLLLQKYSTTTYGRHNVRYLNGKTGIITQTLAVDNVDGRVHLRWNGNTFSAAGTYACGTGVLNSTNKSLVELHATQT
jgi:hypothetical protein